MLCLERMENSHLPFHGGHDIIPQNPLDRLKPYRKDASKRRRTFDKYPKNAVIPKEKLINNGFYYIGDGKSDKVQCVHCGGVLSGWERDDDVMTEHQRFFPRCPLFSLDIEEDGDLETDGDLGTSGNRNAANFSYSIEEDRDLETDGTSVGTSKPVSTMNLAIKSQNQMRYPEFKDESERRKSFAKWPKDAAVKDTITLAKTGLFFTGTGDQCLCYVCGNMLEEWEEGDNPKTEHDKYFDDCPLANKSSY